MVVGIVYLALGMKKVVNYVADTSHHDLGDPLATVPLVALYGGVVLYLLAHICFRLRNVHSLNRQRLGLAVLLVVLLPLVAHVPALAALGVLAGLMVALIGYEVTKFAEARETMRHAGHRVKTHSQRRSRSCTYRMKSHVQRRSRSCTYRRRAFR